MSFWGGLKKVLGVAAPIAAEFIPIPGVNHLAATGIRAAIGAGGGALAGGKKGAAIGAGASALGSILHNPGDGGGGHSDYAKLALQHPNYLSGLPGVGGGAGDQVAKQGGNIFSKILGKLDPTALALGGLSMLGKDQLPYQERKSYTGMADPNTSLNDSLGAIRQMAAQLSQHQSPQIPGMPAPVQIPGLPFQIGGGMGMDPSMFQQAKLDNPFANGAAPATPAPSPTTRRRPQ